MEAWLTFHEENPHVYDQLEGMAISYKRKGINKIGFRHFWEVLRWWRIMSTDPDYGEYKLPNDFCPYYARYLMAANPSLPGFFVVGPSPGMGVQSSGI